MLAFALLLLAASPSVTVDPATFTPPDGFVYDAHEGTDHATLTHIEKTNWCIISIYRGIARNADLAAQFAADWKDPMHATAAQPAAASRKVGGAAALEASGPAAIGAQVLWGDLVDVDAGANVVTIATTAPSEALFPPCRKALDAVLSTMTVKKATAPVAAATPAAVKQTAATTITAAEMVGEWTTGDSSTVSYVDSYSGNYAGSSSVFYGERYDLHADGTYDYSFSGMANNHIVREKAKGSWALGPAKIIVTPEGRAPQGYDFVSIEKGADGSKTIVVLSDVYKMSSGAMLYKNVWKHVPKK